MNYPKCYRDFEHYRDWVELAKLAREVISPCDDCNARYAAKMVALERCDKEWVKTIIIGSRKKQS